MSSSSINEKSSRFEESSEVDLTSDSELANGGVDVKKVLRKLDLRLLPFVTLLFTLSFLDRTNIGNAKVAGLTADLHLTGLQYNLCAAVFFIPYPFFEVPSNLALKLLPPSRWIPFIVFCWSVVLISMAFVKSFGGLITARLFLGMTEAGLFPGITFYLCSWYPREAQALRLGIFSSAASLAGAFGGLLALAIEKMDGIGGIAGWSWIFLLEGVVTVIVAIVAFFCMYDYPENATFLTEAERKWLLQTLKNDSAGASKNFKWKFLRQALRDPHSYLMMGIFLFIIIPAYSFALFLPTIISGLGFSAAKAQLLSVPPNAIGCVITLSFGALADKLRIRGPLILAGSLTALIGYVTLFSTTTPGAGYAGTLLAACGIFPSVAFVLSWMGGNVGGDVKRAVVIAMVIGVGNLGGIVSSFSYRAQDSPRYRLGHAINISCLCVLAVLCIIAMLEFSRLNRQKIAQCEKEGITKDREGEFVEMGDASPLYRYTI